MSRLLSERSFCSHIIEKYFQPVKGFIFNRIIENYTGSQFIKKVTFQITLHELLVPKCCGFCCCFKVIFKI